MREGAGDIGERAATRRAACARPSCLVQPPCCDRAPLNSLWLLLLSFTHRPLPHPLPLACSGAIIHVIGDFVQSIGVCIAGALIWWHQVGFAGVPFARGPFAGGFVLNEVKRGWRGEAASGVPRLCLLVHSACLTGCSHYHTIGHLSPSHTLRPVALRPPRLPCPQDDPRWFIADPICTFLFAVLVLWTTRAILRDISGGWVGGRVLEGRRRRAARPAATGAPPHSLCFGHRRGMRRTCMLRAHRPPHPSTHPPSSALPPAHPCRHTDVLMERVPRGLCIKTINDDMSRVGGRAGGWDGCVLCCAVLCCVGVAEHRGELARGAARSLPTRCDSCWAGGWVGGRRA